MGTLGCQKWPKNRPTVLYHLAKLEGQKWHFLDPFLGPPCFHGCWSLLTPTLRVSDPVAGLFSGNFVKILNRVVHVIDHSWPRNWPLKRGQKSTKIDPKIDPQFFTILPNSRGKIDTFRTTFWTPPGTLLFTLCVDHSWPRPHGLRPWLLGFYTVTLDPIIHALITLDPDLLTSG